MNVKDQCLRPSVKMNCLVTEGQTLTAKADRRKKDLRCPCHLEPNLALSAKLLVNKSIWTRILNTREGTFLGFLHFLPDPQFRKEENKRERGKKMPSGYQEHSAGQSGAQHPDLSSHVFCTDRPAHSSEAEAWGFVRRARERSPDRSRLNTHWRDRGLK